MKSSARPSSDAPPGIGAGLGALASSFAFIARRPQSWPWAAVPGVLVLTLFSLLAWLSFGWLGPQVGQWLLPDADSWYAQGARFAVRWLSSLVAAYLALLASLLLAPSLSAPALEHLVRLQEQALGVPERPPQSFFRELWCGLASQSMALSLTLPAWVLVWTLGLLLPMLGPLWLALQVLVGSLAIAWNLLDYPLTLRGVGSRERLGLLRRHPTTLLGFGGAFALLFSVPGAAIALLPVGVVAATRLVWRLVESDPLATRMLGTPKAAPEALEPGPPAR